MQSNSKDTCPIRNHVLLRVAALPVLSAKMPLDGKGYGPVPFHTSFTLSSCDTEERFVGRFLTGYSKAATALRHAHVLLSLYFSNTNTIMSVMI